MVRLPAEAAAVAGTANGPLLAAALAAVPWSHSGGCRCECSCGAGISGETEGSAGGGESARWTGLSEEGSRPLGPAGGALLQESSIGETGDKGEGLSG